jgi:hypothetical protein
MSTAERVYEEVRTLPEDLAREVLDFVEFLKTRRVQAGINAEAERDADADWSEFDQLAGAWEGKFHRDECYDRAILR